MFIHPYGGLILLHHGCSWEDQLKPEKEIFKTICQTQEAIFKLLKLFSAWHYANRSTGNFPQFLDNILFFFFFWKMQRSPEKPCVFLWEMICHFFQRWYKFTHLQSSFSNTSSPPSASLRQDGETSCAATENHTVTHTSSRQKSIARSPNMERDCLAYRSFRIETG